MSDMSAISAAGARTRGIKHRSRSAGVVLAIALVLNVVGPSAFNILPLLSQGAMHTLNFTDQQVGVLSVAVFLGFGVSAFVASMWVRSVPWPRAAGCSLGGMAAAHVLSLVVHDYRAFVLVQGVGGFFGGSVLCLAVTILSDCPESARFFGIGIATQVAFQLVALLVGPTLLQWAGLDGILGMLAALSALTMILAPLLPARGREVISGRISLTLLKPATVIALAGFGTYFLSVGAYWTYIEPMGEARGMTARAVTKCVAAAVSAGILGGVFAWMLGERLGRLWPLGIATFLTVVAALMLNASSGSDVFLASGLLYFFACNYAFAYQTAIVNTVDLTGRAVALTSAVAALGAAGGAALAALWVSPGDYHVVIWIMPIAVCLSTALFIFSLVIHRRTTGLVHA